MTSEPTPVSITQAAGLAELDKDIHQQMFHRLTPTVSPMRRYDNSIEVVERVLEGLRAL